MARGSGGAAGGHVRAGPGVRARGRPRRTRRRPGRYDAAPHRPPDGPRPGPDRARRAPDRRGGRAGHTRGGGHRALPDALPPGARGRLRAAAADSPRDREPGLGGCAHRAGDPAAGPGLRDPDRAVHAGTRGPPVAGPGPPVRPLRRRRARAPHAGRPPPRRRAGTSDPRGHRPLSPGQPRRPPARLRLVGRARARCHPLRRAGRRGHRTQARRRRPRAADGAHRAAARSRGLLAAAPGRGRVPRRGRGHRHVRGGARPDHRSARPPRTPRPSGGSGADPAVRADGVLARSGHSCRARAGRHRACSRAHRPDRSVRLRQEHRARRRRRRAARELGPDHRGRQRPGVARPGELAGAGGLPAAAPLAARRHGRGQRLRGQARRLGRGRPRRPGRVRPGVGLPGHGPRRGRCGSLGRPARPARDGTCCRVRPALRRARRADGAPRRRHRAGAAPRGAAARRRPVRDRGGAQPGARGGRRPGRAPARAAGDRRSRTCRRRGSAAEPRPPPCRTCHPHRRVRASGSPGRRPSPCWLRPPAWP